MIQPDFIAKVRLFDVSEGGRKGPTQSTFFGCPLLFNGALYDCRMLLDEVGAIAPGDEKEVPIKMLDWDAVRTLLRDGAEFEMWESRVIGTGKISKLLR